MNDRGTLAIRGRKDRVSKVLQRIEENQGIAFGRLRALLSLELGVSPDTIEEYLSTYSDAGLIEYHEGNIWTRSAWEKSVAAKEDQAVQKAKELGIDPIESYMREDSS